MDNLTTASSTSYAWTTFTEASTTSNFSFNSSSSYYLQSESDIVNSIDPVSTRADFFIAGGKNLHPLMRHVYGSKENESFLNSSTTIISFASLNSNAFSVLNTTLSNIATGDTYSSSSRFIDFNTSIETINNSLENPYLLSSLDPEHSSSERGTFWQNLIIGLLKLIIMGGIILVAILGNILVIVSISLNRKLHSLANQFLVSLATADIMVAVCVMSFNASVQLSGKWMFGTIICDLWNSFDVYFSTVSILHLCCISMDRYYAIIKPLEYPIYMTRKVVLFMITISWLLPTLISFLPIFLGWYATADYLQVRVLEPESCTFEVNAGYALLSSCLSFWVPCTVMLVMYFRIFQEARKQEAAIMSRTNSSSHMNHSRRKRPIQTKLRQMFSPAENVRIRRDSSEKQDHPNLQLEHLPAMAKAARKSGIKDCLSQARPSVTDSIVSGTRCSVGSSPCLCSLSDKETLAEYSNTLPSDKSRRVSLPLHDRSDIGTPLTDAFLPTKENNALKESETHHGSKCSEFEAIPEHKSSDKFSTRIQPASDVKWSHEETYSPAPVIEARARYHDSATKETELKRLNSVAMDTRIVICDEAVVACKRSSFVGMEAQFMTSNSPRSSLGKHSQRSRGNSETLESRSVPHAPMMKREHKAARTLGIIMGAFILCWLPFFTWYVAANICGEHCFTPEPVVALLFWIGYFNSTLNPFIYAYFRADFREAFLYASLQPHIATATHRYSHTSLQPHIATATHRYSHTSLQPDSSNCCCVGHTVVLSLSAVASAHEIKERRDKISLRKTAVTIYEEIPIFFICVAYYKEIVSRNSVQIHDATSVLLICLCSQYSVYTPPDFEDYPSAPHPAPVQTTRLSHTLPLYRPPVYLTPCPCTDHPTVLHPAPVQTTCLSHTLPLYRPPVCPT
ncbi:G protein-coupled receptor rhodopsin-like [Trinorchestia longiramus]|nr:G protein-coupled receptor rhodopsin-like [Trinorchestia longiramus]